MTKRVEEAAVEMFGPSLRNHIVDRVLSGWATDPLFLGSYSAALPGHGRARAVLARPFDERVRLAGEACSVDHFGTVHGAWFTGVNVVNQLVAEGIVEAQRQRPGPS